jgi:hypothetical protein
MQLNGKSKTNRVGILLSTLLLLSSTLFAQLPDYPYPDFTPGRTISSAEVNSNFSLVADYALKRDGGGNIEGHLTLDPNITLDGVDIDDFLLSTGHIRTQVLGTAGTPAYGMGTDGWFFAAGELHFSLSGVEQGKIDANGLTIRGTNIFNSSGKIPSITSTYFGNLAAQELQLAESSFTDGSSLTRLAADETITGTYSHTKGTITSSKPLRLQGTWNNAGVSFVGVDVSITNTASNAASKLWDVKVGGSSKIRTEVGGKTIAPTIQVTDGARAGYFLVGDGTGLGTWQPSASSGPVPTGMLAFFEASCPTGWTSKSSAGNTYENKFLRGGGTFSGVGGGSDTHTHSIDPLNKTSTTESNGHTHTLDIGLFAYPQFGDSPWVSHSISGTTGVAGGSHTHTFTTGGVNGFTSGDAGGSLATGGHTHSGTTDSTNIDHTHGAGSLAISGVSNHNTAHSIDFPSTTTSGASTTHTHDLDISAFSSGAGNNVPAYVQVIVCRKD